MDTDARDNAVVVDDGEDDEEDEELAHDDANDDFDVYGDDAAEDDGQNKSWHMLRCLR